MSTVKVPLVRLQLTVARTGIIRLSIPMEGNRRGDDMRPDIVIVGRVEAIVTHSILC